MLDYIDTELHLNGNGGESKKKILKLAEIFHDIVYIPGSKTNEDDSIEIFKIWVSMLHWDDYTHIKNIDVSTLYLQEKFLEYAFNSITGEEKNKVIELIKIL
jgi:hypothetical protein